MGLTEAIGKGQPGVERLGSVVNPDSAQPLAALATALLGDGIFISLPAGARMAEPVHIISIATGAAQKMSAPRVLIHAGAGSELTVVESYLGAPGANYFTCAVSEIILDENASVHHYKDNRESDGACHIATLSARLARDSRFDSHSLSFGGGLTRNDISVELAGEGADCALNGLYFTRGAQHVDHHTLVDHAVPHGTSNEFYKGVLDGDSTAVFNGRVIVRKDAQKSDAHQTNKNLILSKTATVNTTPQLEILADDVKCAHGATIGQLSPDALFYLRTRGIGEAAARDLLTYAFASEVVEKIKVAPLRERLDRILLSRLPIDLRLQKSGDLP
jgi:Fe-S cluster assembly protein SufD